MEKLEFRSEAEKEIFMQLISKKEAIRLCFEQKDSSFPIRLPRHRMTRM